ncbi:uncharacterized transposon-derived protein F54H12.3 [Trichonephila clavipes]|nr:uncharacterized transposon-derived protein F54H12.3 [Trichonephila clavipes]
MVMSETHSEKRKFGKAGESSVNKKARREVSKKYGKFTEDCIPDGVFPIGDDVFVFASTYYDSASVHIRRFKKYGKTYYPTPEGITLDPRWIEYIMRKKKVPESLEELPSGLFPPERHIQITSENFIDFTFKRIKYSPDKEPTFKEITISREQWAEMIKKYGAIENAAIDNMFQCMDFLTAYKTFCEGPIENTLPSSLDLRGVEALHRSVKGKYSKKDVKHWLSQKDAYTLHKPVRHKFQRNRVFVSDIDRQFQADLVDMQSLAEFNKGYKYLLTCIDLFSKFAWAVPLKDKFGKSVKSGLEIIFKERKPKVLQTDAGYEQNWRRELFIVFEIVQRIPIVYRLKDLQGEEIKGTYYEAELQKVVDSGFYPVENVIKQRKRGGITEYFVKFLGYPEKFNDWVTDIQKV